MTEVVPVGSTEFEDRFAAKVEKNSPGYRLGLVIGQDQKTFLRGDDLLMNFLEKRPRLGRKAVVFARLTMQTVKCL